MVCQTFSDSRSKARTCAARNSVPLTVQNGVERPTRFFRFVKFISFPFSFNLQSLDLSLSFHFKLCYYWERIYVNYANPWRLWFTAFNEIYCRSWRPFIQSQCRWTSDAEMELSSVMYVEFRGVWSICSEFTAVFLQWTCSAGVSL